MLDRRSFLSTFSSLAALGAAPWPGPSAISDDFLAQFPTKLPDRSLYDTDEETYWTEVRKLFLIPEDEVYLNNGTVGSSPAPVLRAVFEGYRDSERLAQSDPEDYPIWGYAAWNQFRDPLAEFIGCKREELALLRNATEANSYIANGIDLNTIATEGWDDTKIRAERFQRIGSSNVPALCGLKASIELANQIGMDRIERRHRKMADYILQGMLSRDAKSWTSPDAALRCGISTVTIAPYKMPDPENWLWKEKKIRIRGGLPSKVRLSTPYYLLKKDIDRFYAGYDEYRHTHPA